MNKENILISSCLLGKNCKYNGGNNYNVDVMKLSEKYNLIEICPEVMGGLSIPRIPCEIIENKVINKEGIDCTEQYSIGAKLSLEIAKKNNCKYAILKENSPSCGFGTIYDGTFTSTKKKGNGITANLLYKNGIVVLNENNFYKEFYK